MTQDPHPIRAEPSSERVLAHAAGHVIADSTRSLVLYEASYPGVRYVPRGDADMTKLRRSSHKTRCPYKGEASYFDIEASGRVIENAIWSYEQPKPVARAIAGYLAFDLRKIDSLDVS